MKAEQFKKYYLAARANKPFLKTSLKQKYKIGANILKFFKNNRKKLIIDNKPVTAQIEPTSQCNLRCEFCIREKVNAEIGTMSFENFRKILDKLDCLFKIHLSGQGEPFLHPELFKMIKYANERGILVNTTSNGTVLTKKIIEDICKVEIGEITISIDSTKKELYESMRKGAKFDRLIENVKNLAEELKKKRRKTEVSFGIIILKENIDEIKEFVKLAEKLGVKKVVFQTLQNKEDYVEKYKLKIKSQRVNEAIERIKEKVNRAEKYGRERGIKVIFDEGKSNEGCVWPWRGIYITWNGYITPCCKILDYNKPGFGNILEEDFWKIWNGKEYQMFRKLLIERKAPVPCRGCSMV